jgi:hypothetical protein
MNAITQPTPAGVVLAEPIPPDSLLNCVARAMTDPAINVDKLEVLLRMQREIVADDARLQFNRAMSKAQADMQPVLRDAKNDQTNSKYARLETIDAAIRPIYTSNGFMLSFNSEPTEGPNERIVCEVSHAAGHSKKFQLEAGLDMAGPRGNANKTPLHGLGSMVSYLRRYLTCMIFNIVLANEDTDGNRAAPFSGDGRITEAQAEELHGLMKRGRFNEGDVLNKVAPGLRSMSQLPAAEFRRVRGALMNRLSVLEQRAAATANQGDRA